MAAKRKKPVTKEASPKKKDGESEKTPDQKQDLMAFWQDRVKTAQRIRRDWETKFKVEECERFILGNQWQSDSSRDPVFNHLLSALLTQRPNLFFHNPKFYVRPKPGTVNKVSERSAAMAEAVLESVGHHEDSLVNAASLALWQQFSRVGVLKIVYDPQIENNPSKGEPIYETNASGEPLIDPKTKQKMQAKDPQTGQPLMEPDTIVTDEIYRYQWVDAVNMLFPDEGPDMTRWTWLGEEVVVPLEDAKKDTRFPENVRNALVSNISRKRTDKRRSSYYEDSDLRENKMIRYYNCFDLRSKKEVVWADGQDTDDFMLYQDIQPGIRKHPYSIMPHWIPNLGPEPSPWPVPYIFSWLDPQREYNIRRKQITEGCKRMARKVYYDDSTFPNADEAAKSLQSGSDMAAVKVNSLGKIPQIQQDPPVPASFFGDVGLLQDDFRAISGLSGARQMNPEKTTATESSYVERASNLRESDLLGKVEQWLSIAGFKMKQLIESTLTLGLYIKIRGFNDDEFKKYAQRVYQIQPEMIEFIPGLKDIFRERYGQEKVEFVKREDLQFDADVSVVPGSFRPHNLEVERSQWLQFLELLGRAPQLALSRELLRETASKFQYISERMLDEIYALSQKMVDINANQAGRNGGGANGSGNSVQQAMAGMMGGMG